MSELRHKRLHLDAFQGFLLGWNPDTRAEERFDLPAEIRAEGGKVEPLEVLHRHLADDGRVTMDAFAATGFESTFKPAERRLLERRAKELNGPDTVDFSRVIRARWSLQTPNRSGIVVPNDAWDMEKFSNTNPIGAWNHRTSSDDPRMIVARWLWVGHATKSEKSDLVGYESFVRHDRNPLATTVLGLYEEGALNAFSPGFLVSFVDFGGDDEDVTFGSKDDPNELVELSNVPIGRHGDAVLFALKSGKVDIGPLREFIALQLEVAYSDPMQIREAAFFEAVGKKLGLVGSTALFEMGIEDVEALELPGAGAPDPAETWVNALRSFDFSALPDADPDAVARYGLGFAGVEPESVTDTQRLVAARVAGLDEGATALEAAMALEAAQDADAALESEEPEEHSAEAQEETPEEVPEEENSAEVEGPEGLSVDAFKAAVRNSLSPLRASRQNREGRLILN